MNLIHITALLALMQYFFFGFLVGRARAKYGIHAPAVAGNEHFERALRVQQNTLEQLVVFLPALFMAGIYWPQGMVALAGMVYLAGRFLYWRTYTANPQSRAFGFLLTVIPSFVLMAAALFGALSRV